MGQSSDVYKIAGGEIVLWLDRPGGPICIKTVEKHHDPVEMAEHEAEELVEVLQKLIAQCR
ncbi:hypothetical protein [Hypericibacter sp.]|uniref:hypothetical protein n=1 Tax=Hypericibacter sp. TaxID=2705401 RepID=UPI003D6CC311